jgi:hypothetical protein
VDEPHVTKLALAFKQAGIDAREVMESWIGAKPGTEGHWLFQKQMGNLLPLYTPAIHQQPFNS